MEVQKNSEEFICRTTNMGQAPCLINRLLLGTGITHLTWLCLKTIPCHPHPPLRMGTFQQGKRGCYCTFSFKRMLNFIVVSKILRQHAVLSFFFYEVASSALTFIQCCVYFQKRGKFTHAFISLGV